MNPEDVGRILDEIGERIGPAGEYAWQLTVRQVVIEGYVWAVVASLAMIITLWIVIWGLRKNPRDEDGQIGIALLGFCTAIGALILGGSSAVILLNPEYHAMTRLLERLIPQ